MYGPHWVRMAVNREYREARPEVRYDKTEEPNSQVLRPLANWITMLQTLLTLFTLYYWVLPFIFWSCIEVVFGN